MRERIWILLVIYGLLLIVAGSDALKPPRPKFKIATSSTTTTTEEPEPEEPEEPEVTTVSVDVNATTGHTLTGIPQIDYIWDPNLPRELNGYNLSSYPFYSTVPEEIDFKCDGLHDGFYASIAHKCQVYHHCLYGTRYDFLCANFTAFDQKTFICHFASEVDCANSKKYWHRNDALYQATTTTTSSTTTTTTLPPPPAPVAPQFSGARPLLRDRDLNRRRRPSRRRPAYDYYDDEYYDDEYDRTRPRGYDRRDGYDYDDRTYRVDRDRDRGRERDRDRDRDYRDPERDRGVRHRERENPSGYGSNHRPLYDQDRDQRDREKIPVVGRPNRREPALRGRPGDGYEEDVRPLARDRGHDSDQVNGDGKSTGIDERRKDLPDIRSRDSSRDIDERSYSDKRYRNDYEDKDPVPVSTASTDGLVKPAAPVSSVYARPRAPPKIRRPVPVSEQDKYAYNTSAVAPAPVTPNDEPRRRPEPVDDDYLDDDLEETRPRRPIRRRPAYRDKEPYDARETRDRDRDRNYRTRYLDEEEDEVRPRKRPDRQRDRHYDRSGDRVQYSYDRERPSAGRAAGSAAVNERPSNQYSSRTAERPSVEAVNTRPEGIRDDQEHVRPKFLARERESSVSQNEGIKKSNFFKQRMEKTIDSVEEPVRNSDNDDDAAHEDSAIDDQEPNEPIGTTDTDSRDKYTEQRFTEQDSKPKIASEQSSPRPPASPTGSRGNQKYDGLVEQNPPAADYASETSSEYYDEEELPVSSPRTTLRIVKRPFLPSRGGNPNPRGLKQVGLRIEPRPEEDRPAGRQTNFDTPQVKPNVPRDYPETQEDREYIARRQPYDAYRSVQREEPDTDEDVVARPQSRRLQKEDTGTDKTESLQSSTAEREAPLSENLKDVRQPGFPASGQFERRIPATAVYQKQTQRGGENADSSRTDEVAHRLQDIPESEYDVTLNDALTPTLNQESNLPSGFILPLHRQLERDTKLQSSQRNYLYTRPTETVTDGQLIRASPSSDSSSYSVPPMLERSRATFPRQPQASIFGPGQHPAPWQGYVEY